MLTRTEHIASIDISPNGTVSVAVNIDILDGDEKVAQAGRRYDIAPGTDYSDKEPAVQAVCAAVHTPEVIAAYQAAQSS
jgi:uncharacterized protein with beta-barrel porin domain